MITRLSLGQRTRAATIAFLQGIYVNTGLCLQLTLLYVLITKLGCAPAADLMGVQDVLQDEAFMQRAAVAYQCDLAWSTSRIALPHSPS